MSEKRKRTKNDALDGTPLWLRKPYCGVLKTKVVKSRSGTVLKEGDILTPSGNIQRSLF